MALIKCPECGHMVSDQALSCPQCGVPLKAKEQAEQKQKIINDRIEQNTQMLQKQQKIFWGAMLFGAMLGLFSLFIGFLSMPIAGLGILYGLYSFVLLTQNPIDLTQFSVPRTIWSFCMGASVGGIIALISGAS